MTWRQMSADWRFKIAFASFAITVALVMSRLAQWVGTS